MFVSFRDSDQRGSEICVFGRAGDPIMFEKVVSLCESGNKASEIFVSFLCLFVTAA